VSGTHQNEPVTTVIDPATLAMKSTIHSFMTGIVNEWVVEPGDMLKQVADIELPQMFSGYEFSTTLPQRGEQPKRVIVELKVPSYSFENFHANVTVAATVYDEDRTQILEKTYSAEGFTQGAKMFWGGAFAMKSAIRQSSFDAYKKVFEQLRTDIAAASVHHHRT
jgi:hypothetical protein